MGKSIFKNSVYYFVYNFINMVFPFVTSLYVVHILTPDAIGEVAFAQNIVSYFSIMAFLGIPTYGMREIAKNRNNQNELNKLYSELFMINMVSTIIFSILYYGMILLSPQFRDSLFLYMLVGLHVILNMLNNSWLFSGLEEFEYVTKRNAFFKLLIFLLLVLTVRDSKDAILYAGINVVGVAGNNVINIFYSRKYVNFSLKRLNLARHIKGIFMLVVVNLAIEIYSLVDTTMLGMLTTNEHVAYYSYGSKVNGILLQVTNTVTMVLVPRISLLYKEKKFDEFNNLLTKGLQAIIVLAVPMIIGIQFTAKFLLVKIYGPLYIHSAITEQILCLNLIISPIGYLLGSRVMLVSSNEKKMVLCVSIGAIVNVIGNLILIPTFMEYGAAVASVISEFVTMGMYVKQGRKIYKLERYKDTLWKVMISAALEMGFLYVLDGFPPSWYRLLFEMLGAAVIYVGFLLIVKERFIRHYYSIFREKICSLRGHVS